VHIVIIGWIYVVALMALTEPTLGGALLTLFGYGLLPVAFLVWIVGWPLRRRRGSRAVSQFTDQPDRADAQNDE
jgi:hypothetical protein